MYRCELLSGTNIPDFGAHEEHPQNPVEVDEERGETQRPEQGRVPGTAQGRWSHPEAVASTATNPSMGQL